ncbi:MAG: hypothetical protein ACRENQ_11760 [Gemmatimonadaceae bacterium]
MPIWNKLKDEVERAGRAAHSAIDEGKLRLDLMRARQSADRSARRLGYATYKAKTAGHELSDDVYNRHASELSTAEAEIARIETLLKEAATRRGGTPKESPEASQPDSESQAAGAPSSDAEAGPQSGAR